MKTRRVKEGYRHETVPVAGGINKSLTRKREAALRESRLILE